MKRIKGFGTSIITSRLCYSSKMNSAVAGGLNIVNDLKITNKIVRTGKNEHLRGEKRSPTGVYCGRHHSRNGKNDVRLRLVVRA